MKKSFLYLLLAILTLVTFETASSAQSASLEPGVSYVLRQFVNKGSLFDMSGPEYHSFIITIYNDKSASGVYLVGLNDYEEKDAVKFKMTGWWRNSSKYDKSVIEIRLKYEDDNNYLSHTIYVDADHNAYVDDMNNASAKLYRKSELDAEKETKETQNKAAEEAEALRKAQEAQRNVQIVRRYLRFMRNSMVLYELVDLGLSVKWANVNLCKAFTTDTLDTYAYTPDAQLDALGNMYSYDWSDPTDWSFSSINRGWYTRDDKGNVSVQLYVDPDADYAAGGKKHGEPHTYVGKELKEALLLSLKYNPNPAAPQTTEERAESFEKIAHYPTKAEWQNLMDNCLISGVETLPSRSNPIAIAYYDNYASGSELEELQARRMLKITSKINGKSIYLPFDARGGTNYATSQYLSTDPRNMTCVHVDSTGLSFVEVKRDTPRAERFVFGDINMKALEADIHRARAEYRNSSIAIEQGKLKEEYEEILMRGVLSIGSPTIEVKQLDDSSRHVEIKAPIISGISTDKSKVMVAIDASGNGGIEFHDAMIIEGNDKMPAHIIWSGIVNSTSSKTGRSPKTHRVFFISDNINYYRGFEPIAVGSKSINLCGEPIWNENSFNQFMSSFGYAHGDRGYKYEKGKEFNNFYDYCTKRRIIVSPMTFFGFAKNNTIQYFDGPAPIQIGLPQILSVGKATESEPNIYYDVIVALNVKDGDYPFGHPTAQSVNLNVKNMIDKVDVKVTYNEHSDNNYVFTINALSLEIPYHFAWRVIDQNGGIYGSSINLVVNKDGSMSKPNKEQLNQIRNQRPEVRKLIDAGMIDPEIEYLLRYRILNTDGVINQIERTVLDKIADQLKISKERSIEIERIYQSLF